MDSAFEEQKFYKRKSKAQKKRSDATEFASTNSFVNSLEEIQFLTAYFEALRNGGPKDLKFIKDALKNDPRRMARGPKDEQRRGNLTYVNGEFPLYVACKYNHLKIIRLLLQGRADAEKIDHLKLYSIRSKDALLTENCLEVAARWGYHDVLDCLLSKPDQQT